MASKACFEGLDSPFALQNSGHAAALGHGLSVRIKHLKFFRGRLDPRDTQGAQVIDGTGPALVQGAGGY